MMVRVRSSSFTNEELSSGYPAVIAEYTLSGSTFATGPVYTHGLG